MSDDYTKGYRQAVFHIGCLLASGFTGVGGTVVTMPQLQTESHCQCECCEHECKPVKPVKPSGEIPNDIEPIGDLPS